MEYNIAELIVMARCFLLLETCNRFANDGLWHGRARGAGACMRGHGGGMTRLLLAAAALVAMLAAAGGGFALGAAAVP